jgi:hypothetical protein
MDSITGTTRTMVHGTRTKGSNGRKSVEVHFNLLGERTFWNPDNLLTTIQDGALYVGDKTFGKLPDIYTEHPTYRRLFGDTVSLFSSRSG